jgi:glycogen(starch) synthase
MVAVVRQSNLGYQIDEPPTCEEAARRIRILILSWEYPPVMVGGLGRHVHALAAALARAGHDVTVATRHAPGAPLDEMVEGVRVVRAPEDPVRIPLDTPNLVPWVMAFNHTLTRTALSAARDGFDVVHAHDWLVAHTAVTLKEHLGAPLVATIHATEAGRHQGWLPGDLNRTIHSMEAWLSHEARRVLVCSRYMRQEVSALFRLSDAKIQVIPNGVDVPRWRSKPADVTAARARLTGGGPLIGFAGRLVHEKGVQHLIDALPELRRRHHGLHLVIAGDGPQRPELEAAAHRLDVADAVSFTGFVGAHLATTMACTDAMVVPSIYEPFGMVALESAAAGAPLAVAATGGLAEIIRPGVTGLTFPTRDHEALAEAVGTLLADGDGARKMAVAARAMVRRRFCWSTVATRTAAAYRSAADYQARNPAQVPARRRPPVAIAEGNLLEMAGLLS